MERSQLKYVVEVAQRQSITKAAQALHLSQPSLSAQIINLERELGVSLFERSRQRISLTQAGEVFAAQAAQILNCMESLEQTMSDYAHLRLGRLRIGVLSIMVPLGIPALLERFAQQAPSLELALTESGSATLLALLKRGELDAAFVVLPENKEIKALHAVRLSESRMMAIVNRKNPLARLSTLPLEALRGQELIIPTNDFNLRRLILSALDREGIPYTASIVCNQIESCFALADRNLGISFCSEQIVAYYPYPQLCYLPLDPPLQRALHLVYEKDPAYHPALKSFLAFVEAEFDRRGRSGHAEESADAQVSPRVQANPSA